MTRHGDFAEPASTGRAADPRPGDGADNGVVERTGTIDLSVAIPTHERPDGLRQALQSLTTAGIAHPERVEVVVSDNSTSARGQQVAASLLERWPGPTRYVRHDPGRGMIGNFNACVELSSGRWKLILHDDDYLLPGGLLRMVNAVRAARPDDRVLLFGVDVVDEHGAVRRRQHFARREALTPAAALARLLRTSSFVRFPAMCVRADAYAASGPFDDSLAGFTDYDMWIRLFSRFGATLLPVTNAAYVVHGGAATEKIFDETGVAAVNELFARAWRTGLLPAAPLRIHQREFLHQFILAGAWRRMRVRDWDAAARILDLLALPEVRRLGVSPRWLPVRIAFSAATMAATSTVAQRASGGPTHAG